MGRARSYDVDLEWTLPELSPRLPEGVRVDGEVSTLTTIDFDTSDRALKHHGISVQVGPDGCSVRLPDDEFTMSAASARTVPREVQGVVFGVRRGRRLIPIAKTELQRRATRIVGPDDEVQAVVTDEQTSAIAFGSPEVIDRRREITLVASDKELRSTLHQVLLESGAQRSRPGGEPPTSVVALTSPIAGAHADKPAEQTVGRLILDYLGEQHDALMRADVALRRGQDVVHSARIAVRRYRSALRVFADIVEPDRVAALDHELQWYSQQLASVRDPQVQRDRLGKAVGALAPELVLGPVAARIEQSLLSEQLKARTALDRTMRGRRYLALLAELESWRHQPPVTKRADRRQSALAPYVRRAERRLTKRLRAAAHGDDAALHRARRAAKRVRYAAELSKPALGRPARRTAARAKKLQTQLGEFVDSAVSGQVLWRLGAATARVPNENGFTFGLLFEAERQRADRMRDRAIRSVAAGRK
jgi:CHAD domain-containing protein